ncbi:MAG: alternative ribosome rescue aminoacyl-tRNA hydrolase ArfB [Candidatus Krumholzibacteriia bacterium]
MSDDLIINNGVTIPGGELEITASRSSGPGGQHVNTSDTRIQVRWNVAESVALGEVQRRRVMSALASRLTNDGDLLVACDTHRSQRRNRDEALQRLAALVRQALVPPRPRKKTRPSAEARRKRLESKRKRSLIKQERGRKFNQD